MNWLKILLGFFFVLNGIYDVAAQKESPFYYVDVLIDADHNIFVQQRKVELEEVTREVRSIVYNIPASKYQGVVYRIYGDKSLRMGKIVDVGTELIKGFDPVRVQRYLLNLEENEIDGANYLEKLKELKLKTIDP